MTYTDVGFSHKLGFTKTVLTPKFPLLHMIVKLPVFCIFLPYCVACTCDSRRASLAPGGRIPETFLFPSRNRVEAVTRHPEKRLGTMREIERGSNNAFRPLLVENHSGLILFQFSAHDDSTRERSLTQFHCLFSHVISQVSILKCQLDTVKPPFLF